MAGGGIPCIEYLIQVHIFLFGVLLETNEAVTDWNMQNTMPVVQRPAILRNSNISTEKRAVIVQVRAQAKVPNFSHKSTQLRTATCHGTYFHSYLGNIRK